AQQAAKKKRDRAIEAVPARPRQRWKMIGAKLAALGEKYGDKRRTQLSAGEELAYDPEAYIVHEDATVILSRDGWLKRVREVKDPSSTRLREGDALAAVLPGTTRDRLVLFSTRGTLYVLPWPTCPPPPATASPCSRSSSSATASASWRRSSCARTAGARRSRRSRDSRRRRSWSPPRRATASAPRPISPRRRVQGGAWRASARATRSCRSSRSPARRWWSPPGAARCSASRSTRWPSSP